MNRDYVLGFLSCIGILCLMGSTSQQINNGLNDLTDVRTELIQIRKDLNENKFQIVRSTPTVAQMGEGQGIVMGGTFVKSLILRVDNSTYSIILNKN